MDTVLFIVLRQMRVPLLLLTGVYAIATLGLTLIPGVDDKGNLWHMDLFHAFYFVSFMGTTTGFGEIPYAFSDGQRMWSLIFIYITVATWVYTIGSLITLLTSDVLRNAITVYSFGRQVRNMREPFSLVCGHGDTGSKLVKALRKRMLPAIVIEIRRDRIDALMLDDNEGHVPALQGDASIPENLVLAGIKHPLCKNIVALTNDNAANLRIAITAKVMNPDLKVICRSNAVEIEANMASFGTEHIIDPFEAFSRDLGLATYAPHQFMLSLWLRGESGEPLPEVEVVPEGYWIINGFGRFGQAIYQEMVNHGLEVQVIEANPEIPNLPDNTIIGDCTGEAILNQAGVHEAAGIIAGTNDDSNNLSTIVTAKQMNPELFVIVRQNEHANRKLFKQAPANVAMEPSAVIARKIKTILTNHAIDEFLSLARARDDKWAKSLCARIRALGEGRLPETWEVTIGDKTPALTAALDAGQEIRIGHLIQDYTDREHTLPVIALFHSNELGAFCQPPIHTLLAPGDRLLFIGPSPAHWKMNWTLHNETSLHYVLTGKILHQSWLGRWLDKS
ncbi:MAG: potassium channel family protein [Pseudomonadales bacterium]